MMKNKFTYLFLCFGLSSFVFAQHSSLRFSVLQRDNFDSISIRKLDSAIVILDSVFNSAEFRNELSTTNFNVGNRGLSNSQLVQMILTGQDDIGESQDSSIDLRLTVYDNYAGGNEFGKTNMQTRVTSTHRCYILNNDLKCYVSHLAHEYLHQIGFYDVRSWRVIRRVKTNSVPYKVGNIVDRLINNNNHCFAQHLNCPRNKG